MISIVIPTLGNSSIYKTIDSIYDNEYQNFEILICIPKKFKKKINLKDSKYKKIKIVETERKEQVYQRCQGFKEAQGNFVLQLDDDIVIGNNCLLKLKESLDILGEGNVVAPIFYDLNKQTHNIHAQKQVLILAISLLYGFLFERAPFNLIKKMGKITSIGVAYSIDEKYYKENEIKSEWVSGGCVMSYRSDLVLYDFYPFIGKAYREDIINSILRSKKEIKHYIIKKTSVFSETEKNISDLFEFINEFKSRKYIVKMLEGSLVIFYIWCFVEFFKRLLILPLKKINKNISN